MEVKNMNENLEMVYFGYEEEMEYMFNPEEEME